MGDSALITDLGIGLELIPETVSEENHWPVFHQEENQLSATNDHFVEKDGEMFAGTHLIFDFWGCEHLDNLDIMEQALRDSVEACYATLLHIHLHHFTPNSGISGVAVLAESHISVHTWPERGYAAFDVFMCGDALPENSLDVLKSAFNPERVDVITHRRGILDKQSTSGIELV